MALSNFKRTYGVARRIKDSFKVSVPKSALKSSAFKTTDFNIKRFRNIIIPPDGISSTAKAMQKMYMSDTARALIKIANDNRQNVQVANEIASIYLNAPARESTAIDHLVNDGALASHHAPDDSSKELITLVQSSLDTQSQIVEVLERLHNQQDQANQIATESARQAEAWHDEDSRLAKESNSIGKASLRKSSIAAWAAVGSIIVALALHFWADIVSLFKQIIL